MAKIIQFHLRNKPSRQQALQWLSQNYEKFPLLTNDKFASERIFHGWRFVLGLDNIVYFANCIDPGITETEMIELIHKCQSKHS